MISLLLPIIYLAFISLGLPDSLLGAVWPTIHSTLGVPLSYAGGISMIIAGGTIFSSLQSDRLTRKLGTGTLVVSSVSLTAIALFGFSLSNSFFALCLWAIPYGLGAGSVDAALNNYVALHYKSRHMSWLHCMWGVGASIGPYIMSYALTGNKGWHAGYRYIAILQIILTIILLLSLPLWKKHEAIVAEEEEEKTAHILSLKDVLKIKGAKEIMITFFCYCALEQTAGLWGSSYLVVHHGVPAEEGARFAALFFLGVTIGRVVSGFVTYVLDDKKMIRLGQGIILVGLCAIISFPMDVTLAKVGLLLVGLGCAPIYPCIIHSTPIRFGAKNASAIIGIEMASAYVGSCIMPPLFGVIADRVSIGLFPIYLLVILILMLIMHEKCIGKTK